MGADPSEYPPIVGSILDWIDQDNDPHVQGTETDYYQSLDTPYEAKNGPIDDLSELLLVRGITQDMYWGSASTNHVAAAFQQRTSRFGSPLAPPSYAFGLVDVFTPISDGKVKLHTLFLKPRSSLGVKESALPMTGITLTRGERRRINSMSISLNLSVKMSFVRIR